MRERFDNATWHISFTACRFVYAVSRVLFDAALQLDRFQRRLTRRRLRKHFGIGEKTDA